MAPLRIWLFILAAVASSALGLNSPRATNCTLSAAGAGKDDAPAFVAAVKSCSTVTIPTGVALNISSKMDMTGQSNKHINLQGTIRLNPSVKYWTQPANTFPITFQTQIAYWLLGGSNILIDGGGTLDGQGQAWYDAFASNSSLTRPLLLTFYQATNVVVQNIKMVNAPEWFVLVNEGKNVTFDNININTKTSNSNPAKNTDGWDLYRSDNVVIKNSIIDTGDDCVSFKPNVTNVLVSNLTCTNSHGISVGSLGQYAGIYDIVENITATDIRMIGSQNGARIKAWAGSGVGSGIVRNVTFANFYESGVQHPVVIDQCYMTDDDACKKYPSNTYIQNIVFRNITGTSSGSDKAVVATLDCSPGSRCSNVSVNQLSLSPPSKYGAATYECQNTVLTGTSASLFGTCKFT